MLSYDALSLAQGIQLSVAPVFLLTAIAGLITALAHRLGRIIDRARAIEQWRSMLSKSETGDQSELLNQIQIELNFLKKRGTTVNWSIGLLTLCAILVSFTIMALFVDEIFNVPGAKFVPAFFLTGLASFVMALICFMIEIYLATRVLHFGAFVSLPNQY